MMSTDLRSIVAVYFIGDEHGVAQLRSGVHCLLRLGILMIVLPFLLLSSFSSSVLLLLLLLLLFLLNFFFLVLVMMSYFHHSSHECIEDILI